MLGVCMCVCETSCPVEDVARIAHQRENLRVARLQIEVGANDFFFEPQLHDIISTNLIRVL